MSDATQTISPTSPYTLKRVSVLDSEMAYIDTGSGDGSENTVIFLHGNPTSSFLWRNIMPHLEPHARCLAPDLIGMGQSGKIPAQDGETPMYRFVDHYRYLSAWLDGVVPDMGRNITLVVHDWGSALGFNWAYHNPERIKAIAYMEAIVCPVSWDDWPEPARGPFMGMRSEKGEDLVLNRNFFIERILPASIMRTLTDEEMNTYRQPYLEAGESRRPTLTWPREIPLAGEPADVVAIVDTYSKWLQTCDTPKLFINAKPGTILTGPQREFCRTWPNQEEVTVKGLHFIQEDSPHEIGEAVAALVQRLS
ncbi:MAG: haloalkane dehalogenase [Chloroflexota bacterium]